MASQAQKNSSTRREGRNELAVEETGIKKATTALFSGGRF